MVKIRVMGGTPKSCQSLCISCTQGHLIRGFRATEEQVFCRFFYIEREILFPVRECTFYQDRRLASKSEMEEIAWQLRTKSPSRSVGFASSNQLRELQEAAESACEAATDDEPSDSDE